MPMTTFLNHLYSCFKNTIKNNETRQLSIFLIKTDVFFLLKDFEKLNGIKKLSQYLYHFLANIFSIY